MFVEEAITKALSQGDNISPSDAAYVDRRRRALSYLQEVFSTLWWSRDWPRRKTFATLTVPAGTGQVRVPTDFESFGQWGRLYLMVDGIVMRPPLREEAESFITDLRDSVQMTDEPDVFAIFEVEEYPANSGNFYDLVQLPPNIHDITLRMRYQRKPPTLLDAGDPDETPGATLTAGNQALGWLPEQYHVTVILPGLKAKLRENKGDARWQKYELDTAKGLQAMKREAARFQSRRRQLPNFFGER